MAGHTVVWKTARLYEYIAHYTSCILYIQQQEDKLLDVVSNFKVEERTWGKPPAFILQWSWHTGLWKYRPSLDNSCWSCNLAEDISSVAWEDRDSQLFNWHFGLMKTDTWTCRLLKNDGKWTFEYFLLLARSQLSYFNMLLDFLSEGAQDSNDGLLANLKRAGSLEWEGPIGFEWKLCRLSASANLFHQSTLLRSFYKRAYNSPPHKVAHRTAVISNETPNKWSAHSSA